MAGFFVVPMNALLQHRGHVLLSAGHSIAVQNFNENISILVMLALYSGMVATRIPVHTIVVIFGLFVSVTMMAVIQFHRRNQKQGRLSPPHRDGEVPGRLEHYRLVGQFVGIDAGRREMQREQRGHLIDRGKRPLLELSLPECVLHPTADSVPICLRHSRGDTAVGDDLDRAVDELHVDQHPAVVLGIPDAQL